MVENNKETPIELTPAQKNFITYCKKFGWGKLEITVKDGQPVMLSIIKQDIKLDTGN